MRRRSYLASTATVLSAAVAGCTSTGDGDPDAHFTLNTVAGDERRSVRVVAST